jgi:ubiquinone biosynthesis monooxygenase Coq7
MDALIDMTNSSRRAPLIGIDRWLSGLDVWLKTMAGAHTATRPSPLAPQETSSLTDEERRLSAALMRVNHVGEVCAQALYMAQSLATKDSALRDAFDHAARDEVDHLVWTRQRLNELGARPSLLNPLWHVGAFSIGWLAGKTSDRLSLGFVVETERQVEAHLASHLDRLPVNDNASRTIVQQMKEDEARHANEAERAGGARLPWPARMLMQAAAKLMTTTAHHI